MTRRIRLSRRPGWRLPANAKSVAYPTRWANPYRPRLHTPQSHARAIELYRQHAIRQLAADPCWLDSLHGYDLACWCPPELPCHVDVLIELLAEANGAQIAT